MKSARKRLGYQVTKWGWRPVDKWREWASVPIPLFKIDDNPRPADHQGPHDTTYTLTEDGVVVGTWRHSDAPWLERWMLQRLGQLMGAWNIAQEQLVLVEHLTNAGAITGRDTKAAATDQLDDDLIEANKQLGANPSLSVAEIAARIARGRNVDYLRRKFVKRDGKIIAKPRR